MFAVCGVTPSRVNHSVLNGELVVMSWGTKLLGYVLRDIDELAYTCMCTWVIAVFVLCVAATG